MPCRRIARRRVRRDSAAANCGIAGVRQAEPRSQIHCKSLIDIEAPRRLRGGWSLQYSAADLVAFHAHEQGLEVALTEAVVASAIDDFEENGANQRLSENLQQESGVRAIQQDAALLQLLNVLPMPGYAFLEHFVVGIRRRRHELQAVGVQSVPGTQYVVRAQRHVLYALASILLDELLDLIDLVAAFL